MRILITGGSGYIGSRFMEALAGRDEVEEIVDLDLRPPTEAIPKVRFVQRDVTAPMRDLFSEQGRPIDVAAHLAWVVDPLHDASRQREICIGGTRRFIEGCAEGEVPHILFVSSGTAYGAHPNHSRPVGEQSPLKDEHHFQYSAEKREAEALFTAHVGTHPGTLLQIARPGIVGGPRVSNYIFRLMEKPIGFRALGHDPEMQLVHEDDVAAALLHILLSRASGAFNVVADGTLRLSALAEIMGAHLIALPFPLLYALSALAWKLGIRSLTEAPASFLYFATYPWLLDNRRLKKELGFEFRHDTRQTLEAFMSARPR